MGEVEHADRTTTNPSAMFRMIFIMGLTASLRKWVACHDPPRNSSWAFAAMQ